MTGHGLDFIYIMFIIILMIFASQLIGCQTSTTRDRLQIEYPDCVVYDNLEINCPLPFDIDGWINSQTTHKRH